MPEIEGVPRASSRALQGLWVAAIYGILVLLAYYQTTESLVSIWLRSDTFAHGFLILPITLWLVWDRRGTWAGLIPAPSLSYAMLLVPLGMIWLLAWLVDVLVVQQFILVAILVAGVCTLLGRDMSRVLAFPLGFLFFAVPIGEALVPPMMELTATSTVWLVQQSGVPVYREGLYFMLPSGNWSVVEACSGVRYLIASATLGVLYAWLTYQSPWRRIVFVIASLIVPVIANSLRAYIIVMLGHWSDMKIATGVDHLIYGWVFFGIVIMLLFWVGSFFREDDEISSQSVVESEPDHVLVGQAKSLWQPLIVLLLLSSVWPLLSLAIGNAPTKVYPERLTLDSSVGNWRPVSEIELGWTPESSVGGEKIFPFEQGDETVTLYVQYVRDAGKGEELVGSVGSFVKYQDNKWRLSDQTVLEVQLPEQELLVEEAIIRGRFGYYLAWSWYRIGDRNTSNDYLAKFWEVTGRLGLSRPESYRLVVATPFGENPEEARLRLQGFLEIFMITIEQGLDRAGSGG